MRSGFFHFLTLHSGIQTQSVHLYLAHRHNLVTCTLHSGIQTESTHLFLAFGHTDTISSPGPSKQPKCSYRSNSYIMKRNQKQTGGFLAGSGHANRTRGWYTLPDTSIGRFSEARHLYWAVQWSWFAQWKPFAIFHVKSCERLQLISE